MHFHHLPAKGEKGYVPAQKEVVETMQRMITEHDVDLVTGDFNGWAPRMIPFMREAGFSIVRDSSEEQSPHIAIFSIGHHLEGTNKTIFKTWKQIDESAHWPQVRFYDPVVKSGRRSVASYEAGVQRWAKSKAKARERREKGRTPRAEDRWTVLVERAKKCWDS